MHKWILSPHRLRAFAILLLCLYDRISFIHYPMFAFYLAMPSLTASYNLVKKVVEVKKREYTCNVTSVGGVLYTMQTLYSLLTRLI